jgi:hypothetical protein
MPGGAGIDAMTTRELRRWLKDHWPQVRAALDAGTYRPRPVGGQRRGDPAGVTRLAAAGQHHARRPRPRVRDCGPEQVGGSLDLLILLLLEDQETNQPGLRGTQPGSAPGAARQPREIAGATGPRNGLLGFGFLSRRGEVKARVDPQARSRAKDRLRQLTAPPFPGQSEPPDATGMSGGGVGVSPAPTRLCIRTQRSSRSRPLAGPQRRWRRPRSGTCPSRRGAQRRRADPMED